MSCGEKLCSKCRAPMDATPSTPPYMDCNTWTCPECGNVEPEIASGKLNPRLRMSEIRDRLNDIWYSGNGPAGGEILEKDQAEFEFLLKEEAQQVRSLRGK